LTQYRALLSTEGVEVSFTEDAVLEIARFALEVNRATENIGARRLATILEAVLDEVSFNAPEAGPRSVRIDAEDVRRKLQPLAQDQDLSRFIL
ncbi:MAG TPA: HslU--HslV peptidase ATPase subunit, partial [Vicinamibacteria bacterium]|nr:HslU--HslV peptidase ATPase subunit [Vicinamibacteria bacterium]